jgi:methyl-accepting chemotaxis protein
MGRDSDFAADGIDATQIRHGANRTPVRKFGVAAKIFCILSLVGATTILATITGVTSMQSYNDQVAALARASERALLGEQLDKLVTAVVMDSRGIYMAASKVEAEKFAPSLIVSLQNLQLKSSQWLSLAPDAKRGKMAEAVEKIEDFVRFRKELVRLAREASLTDARSFGDNDLNRANRSQLNKSLTALVGEDSLSLVEITQDLAAFYRYRLRLLVGLCFAGLLVGGTIALFVVHRAIARPLSLIASAISAIATGNLRVKVPDLKQRDEIGDLGKALRVFKDNALLLKRMEIEQSEAKLKSEEERKTALHRVAAGFEAVVGTIVQTVSARPLKLKPRPEASTRQPNPPKPCQSGFPKPPGNLPPTFNRRQQPQSKCPHPYGKLAGRFRSPTILPIRPCARPSKRMFGSAS